MRSERSILFKNLLTATLDGDWGEAEPTAEHLRYRIIRGTDFSDARRGSISQVPTRYIKSSTAERRTLAPGDIIIETAGGSKNRPTGRTLFVTEELLASFDYPVTCASFCRFLRVDPKLAEPPYIYWFLQNMFKQGLMWQHQVQHTGVARFQYTTFAETVRVPLPSRREQQKVAAILGSLDDKITANAKVNQTLEAMARAIFKSWFIDFDPVHAKQRGEQPTGLDPETAALFPDRLTDSELGEIPEAWEVKPIKEVMSIQWGCSPPGHTYNEEGEGLPFFQGSKEFRERFPEVTRYCTDPKRIAQPGDTMMSIRAPVGAINMADRKCIVGRGVTAVRHTSKSSSFTYYSMLNLSNRLSKYSADGTVFKSITKRNFVAIPFLSPPAKLIERFDQLVASMDAKIRVNADESEALRQQRDILLPKLLSGDLETTR